MAMDENKFKENKKLYKATSFGAVQNTVSPFKFFQAAKQEKDINNRDPSY